MLTHSFKSGFAEKLHSFIEQKNALGLPYKHSSWFLSRFDDMCHELYPSVSTLTKEICDMWATCKATEKTNAFRNRISPIREFAKYLIRNNEEAYIIPTSLTRKAPRHLPYIYSKSDISMIWNEYDNLMPISYSPTRHLVLPAIMRILYCCGLRPIEASRLKPQDVDLSCGKLYICESKGHKDRIVMIADDMAEYLYEYDERISFILPNREWFFPNPQGGFCTNRWLNESFMLIRKKLKICGVDGNPPRLYDLRHTFATHKLYEWMRDGIDLNTMLPYLSAYMGHSQFSDTCYYIHLVPEQFQATSGIDLSLFEELLPEVDCYD